MATNQSTDESDPTSVSEMNIESMSEMEILLKSYNLGLNSLAKHILEMHELQRDFIKKEINEQVTASQDKILIILAQYFGSLVKDYSEDLKATQDLRYFYEKFMKFVVEELQLIREENKIMFETLQVKHSLRH